MQKEGSETHRSEFGPVFSRVYSFFSSILPSSRRRYQFITQTLPIQKNSKVLDVGCGTGNLVRMIAQAHIDVRVYGVDPSLSMVKISQKKAKNLSEGNHISISQGDCLNVPFKERFDIIVTSSSYHHWVDKGGGVRNLVSLLNDGGTFTIFEGYEGTGKNGRSSSETHSLSYEEAKSIVVEGYESSISVQGGLIAVSFKRASN